MANASSHIPRIILNDGTLEFIKYAAAILMTLDHINWFLLEGGMPALYVLGRVVFPLFAFILGWNLARPGLIESGAGKRILIRLFLFGLLAAPPYLYLHGLPRWQMNIMFTLFIGTALVLLLHRRTWEHYFAAGVLFIVSGAFVEYVWVGTALCVASWLYCRNPSWESFTLWSSALASLYLINGNFAALAVVPILFIASGRRLKLPRIRHFFYWYYPLHLFVLTYIAAR